jgi:hypothetical protein
MRLQREEVIRLACASSRKVDPVVRHKKVGVIEADIEARWHAIWSSRPVD